MCIRDRAAGADDDQLFLIDVYGNDSGGDVFRAASIEFQIEDASDPDGRIIFSTHDGARGHTQSMVIENNNVDFGIVDIEEVDVNIFGDLTVDNGGIRQVDSSDTNRFEGNTEFNADDTHNGTLTISSTGTLAFDPSATVTGLSVSDLSGDVDALSLIHISEPTRPY